MLFSGGKKTIKDLRQQLDEADAKLTELQKRNSSMKAIIKSMAEGVIVVDSDTKILAINHSAEQIFGILKKDAEDKLLLEAIRSSDISDIANKVLKKGSQVSQELILLQPVSGSFMINASAITEGEHITGCVLVIHDITDLRKLESIRKDFVANVSHELKTPLTSIKGFIETLLSGALDDKKNSVDFLKIVASHVNRLDSLVNDLLSLSYLESMQAELKKENIALAGLVSDTLAGFKAQIAKKSVKVENSLPASLIIMADKDKISQVLTNFIDNAIKFNRQNGAVKIYSEDIGSKIKVVVEDSGIGIPPRDILRIFERFYRVDKARSRELGGTGLGLSIVKHIIELHNGEVGVESTEGAGSKFWFTLPK